MNTSHTTTTATAPAVTRWTRLHILLHWMVALLIAVQFLLGDSMSALFRATVEDGAPEALPTFLGLTHMAIGIAVFLAIAVRLWDRWAHGRPPHPPGEPTWAQRLAAVTQALLYAVVLAMPVAGLIAWFSENEGLASLHALAAKLLFALIVLHAAGALANHYWFKTDVLRRMLPGHGRDASGPSRRKPAR